MTTQADKVRAEHLRRDAYLYVRQSSLRQVLENTESTQRQYALRDRAVALGWSADQVVVIDSDQGQSGADTDREGFQRLVAEVGMGRAGIVLGLEVSRLARNCADWHHLLEICGLTGTLILDEDGLYDPQDFNDRLVLGLKGTMSEAELHLLRARLRGGLLHKARRGELRSPLPVGLIHDDRGRVCLDPDVQIRRAVERLFDVFRATRSALAVVKRFRREGWLFPRRARKGPTKGQVLWGPLGHTQVLNTLHNPRYAGAYTFGRRRVHRNAKGKLVHSELPQEEWTVLIVDAHPGYIGWDEFQANRRKLAENAQAHGADRRHGPPGTGCARLQGLAVCGKCGRRMTVRYHHRFGRLVPLYVCQRDGIERGEPFCENLPGKDVDAAIDRLVVERLTPAAVAAAVEVQRRLLTQLEQADELRRLQVERVRYEADLARRRYCNVDPANRLVAQTLEAEWNDKLRELRVAEEDYEQRRRQDRLQIDERVAEELRLLATDFQRLWADPKTSDQDRKRLLRLLIEDVTLTRQSACILVQVRYRGGAAEAVEVGRPRGMAEIRKTPPAVIRRLDELLDECTYQEAAERLNGEGVQTGTGRKFTARHVLFLRWQYGLRTRHERLRAAGYKTADEMATELGVSRQTVQIWRRAGLLRALPTSDRGDFLFEPLGEDRPRKQQGWKLSERAQKT